MKVIAAIMLTLCLLMVTPPAEAKTVRHAAHIAMAQRGDPYVFGADGPNAFDCSGLVKYSFRKAGYRNVPRTSRSQARATRTIPRSRKRPGDLLFYHSGGRVFHVAIFVGRHKVVEAARPGTNVRVARVWQAPYFVGTLRPRR